MANEGVMSACNSVPDGIMVWHVGFQPSDMANERVMSACNSLPDGIMVWHVASRHLTWLTRE